MTLGASRFLDPRTLAGIHDLELVARTVVEGFLTGLHVDRRPGSGAEFSQHRSYQPGDDLRRLDWRVFARSDRYFVREEEVERDVTVRFVVDASASMDHANKFEYARFLAASLAYLVDRQGDRPAVCAMAAEAGHAPVASRRPRRLLHLLHFLESLDPRGRWPARDEALACLGLGRARELIVAITDLHQRGEIDTFLTALRGMGHEVLVLHLLSRDELEFDHSGDLLFEDAETGETVRANAERLRPDYLRRLAADLEATRRRLLAAGIGYERLETDRPLDRALRTFLLRRRLLG